MKENRPKSIKMPNTASQKYIDCMYIKYTNFKSTAEPEQDSDDGGRRPFSLYLGNFEEFPQ